MSTLVEIEVDVDLNIEIPCEDKLHGIRVPGKDEPAAFRTKWSCTSCDISYYKNICDPDVRKLKLSILKCTFCERHVFGNECLIVICKL